MARRSLRVSSGATPSPAHKRAASQTVISGADLKRSKRASTGAAAQKQEASETDDDQLSDAVATTSVDEAEGSEYGDDDDDDDDEMEAVQSESEEPDDDESDDDPTPRRKSNQRKSAGLSAPTHALDRELWRPGVKTGLGPGKQVIIKKPKARPAGSTPYTDDTIHPNTLAFLGDLKAHNDREWLKMNDPDFRQSERDWYSFVDKITEALIEIDETVPELPVKDVIFRIYRDVRFSSDPTPYKPHFSAAWSRTGRKGPYAHYYVQIGPDKGLVGGGLWHPEAAPTAALRRDIDRRPRRIKDVLLDERIRSEFLGGAPKVDAKAVKAFVSGNKENALKTKPKGYGADHADIELLRLRNYTIGRQLTRSEMTGPSGLATITRLLTALKPFITYLNSVVMPDEGESGSGSDDGSASSEVEDGNEGSESDGEHEGDEDAS